MVSRQPHELLIQVQLLDKVIKLLFFTLHLCASEASSGLLYLLRSVTLCGNCPNYTLTTMIFIITSAMILASALLVTWKEEEGGTLYLSLRFMFAKLGFPPSVMTL